jgi:hypothetical protein
LDWLSSSKLFFSPRISSFSVYLFVVLLNWSKLLGRPAKRTTADKQDQEVADSKLGYLGFNNGDVI